ncbi:hypothetical protein JCM10207_003111 [Rhodosporidiobolus poonsookiae]
MPAWAQRRQELNELIAELPPADGDAALSLHLAILRADEAQQQQQVLTSPQKRLRAAALSPDDFASLSTLSQTGAFSRVELVRPSATLCDAAQGLGKVYVMKTVERRWAFRMREQQSLRHELAILRLGSAPSSSPARIPRLVASFLSPTSFHLVISHAPGGDVWTVLERKNEGVEPGREVGLPEEWVRRWMAELVDAVEWLHGQGWAHRDIKPQNLLLLASGHLLLTDFGSAAPLTPGTSSLARKYCRALTGTPDYIAPEVLRHQERVFEENEDDEDGFGEASGVRVDWEESAYGAEVDVWACGVVLYELLVGRAPFFAEEVSETYERIVDWKKHLTFPSSSNLSDGAQGAIKRLLVSAEARPSFADIKALSWFNGIDWANLRSSQPSYSPPPFHAPPSSPSLVRSTASFQTDLSYSSFFSSPGLSILRPSPRSLDSARREEREYWEAREVGGLTTLAAANEFNSGRAASPAPVAPVEAVPPRPAPAPDRSAFETPARPSLARSGRPHASTTGAAPTGTPQSSGRARRMISEMDAWREMQEHAWVVGTSARKQRHEGGVASGSSALVAVRMARGQDEKGAGGQDDAEGEKLGGLEQRQREMVQRLEEMDKKYEGLFALAAKEVGGEKGQ